MHIDEFDYELPAHLIAQTPIEPRDHARMLVDSNLIESGTDDGQLGVDSFVSKIGDFLRAGDLLVINDTKVLPARLILTKATGGSAEVLLLEPLNLATSTWKALIKPARRLPVGTQLFAQGVDRPVVVIGAQISPDGVREVTLDASIEELDSIGEMPLPHYITEPLADPDRYQTVYARNVGSVAAPTAGLHFTEHLLESLQQLGVEIARVELQVGLGTFKPVAVDDLDDHVMHVERYVIPTQAVTALAACRARGGRIVCVGTTSLRAIESYGQTGAVQGATDLFIKPGFSFTYADLLLTNFHLPKSTLLSLIAAFYGPNWRSLYGQAIAANYRMLSFGDAMLLAYKPSVAGPALFGETT